MKADSDPKKDWTYSWTRKTYKDKIKEKGGDPFKCTFTAIEKRDDLIIRSYSVLEDEKEPVGDTQITIITNTYDVRSLKLLKKMKSFINNGDKVTTTFVFEVKGNDEAGNEVYHTRVGLQVNPKEFEKEIEIPDIPRTVASLSVKEVYAGGYTPEPADWQDAEPDPDDAKTYRVTFTNTFNTPYYSGGVINRFNRKLGEDNKPTYEWKAIGSVFQSKD